MNNKKAFTLIELLVVIAIIAILAAILFPVFAQAKEAAKKTQSISNAKNQGLGVVLYTESNEDTYPLMTAYDTTGGKWWWNFTSFVPAGWPGGASNQVPWKTEDESHWGNAIQVYLKNTQVYQIAGAKLTSRVAAAGIAIPAQIGFTYNGLLHAYSATAVASPSTLPLFWNGQGKQNLRGEALSNPILRCELPGPACQYNPKNDPQTGLPASSSNPGGVMFRMTGCTGDVVADRNGTSSKIHGDDTIFVYADSSVKPRKIAMQNSPNNTDGYVDPQFGYQGAGRCWTAYWWDGAYPWLFRPDYQP